MKIISTKTAPCMMLLAMVISFALPLQASIRNNFTTQQTADVENRQLLALSWGDIWNKLRPKKSKRGSRSDDENKEFFCMISPGKLKDPNDSKQTSVVWSTRPLFLWKENKKKIKSIEVRHIRSNKLMWESKNLQSATNMVVYQGEPLKPGEAYFWREAIPLEQLPSKLSFRIMEAKERDRISAELKEQKIKLKAKGASADKITLERVKYFANKELWSDVLREMYSVENPSPKLKEKIQLIESHNFCSLDKGEQKLGLVSGK